MKRPCSTLVLDLDGTLSDPRSGISRCINHALQQYGFPTVAENVITKSIGRSLDSMFLELSPHVSIQDIPALVTAYRERYFTIGYSENFIYPDIVPALVQMHEAGLRLGVCTSKRRDIAEKVVSLFGLSRFFAFVDGGDIGISKEMQLARLLQTGTIDRDAIMVGDRAIDVNSATANGLRSIGVLWGFGSHAELAHASPAYLVETVQELCELLI